MTKVIRIPRTAPIVTNGVQGGIAYQRPQPSGNTIEFAVYDDFWQQINNPYPATPFNPSYVQQLDLIADPTGDTLLYNNAFGNKYRFTDDAGVEQNLSGSNRIIDNLTGLQWLCLAANGSYFWTFANTFGVGGNLETVFNSGTFGGFTDWRVPSAKEWQSVFKYNYLFGTEMGLRIKTVNRNLWASSTTNEQDSTVLLRLAYQPSIGRAAKTGSNYHTVCRNYF